MHDKDKHVPTPAERFRLAHDMIKTVLDDPEVISYSVHRTPLTLDMLSDEAALRVTDVAGRWGWPTEDDASITPAKDFTDFAFLSNLFEHPSKTPVQHDDMTDDQHQAVERNENALNNFKLHLRATPIDSVAQAGTMEGWYGIVPVVHRANALAPELFTALREAMSCFELGEQEFAKNLLAREENKDMVTALNMGYRIMGRLLKKDDLAVGVHDAHVTLTA